MIKIDENDKITIKLQLLRSISARLEWGEASSSTKEELKKDDIISMTSEISRMSFEPTRHNVDRSMSLDKKNSLCTTKELSVSRSMKMN
mgnify:CR=1 FL=1